MNPMDQKRIVCVDDQESALFVLKLSLAHGGYAVTGFHDYEGAELYIKQNGAADGYVLDFNLGGKTSDGLVGLLRQQGLNTPVLVLSGNLDDAKKAFSQYPDIAFLGKPYVLNNLHETLKRVLGE